MTLRAALTAALPFLLLPAPAMAEVGDDPLLALPEAPPPILVIDLAPYPEFVPFVPVPPPSLDRQVRALLEEAMQSDDTAAVAAVVKFAVASQPYDKDEIKAMHRAYTARIAQALAAKTAAEHERIRRAGLFDLWKGQVELGAFRSTGNTDNFGYSGSLSLNRIGLDWEHTILARADYQKDRGTVTREQYLASYQPRYTLDEGLFAYGRSQYERDRIQGFSNRYTLSGGLGYRALNRPGLTLALEAGPAARRTNYVEEPSETTWSLLTSMDFDWKISDTIKLTQDASSYLGSDNSTFTSLTGIEAGMTKGLRAKLSYSIEHETSPPEGSLKTDTISRFSLVYGF